MTRNARFLAMLLPVVACTGGTESSSEDSGTKVDTADTAETGETGDTTRSERGCLAVSPEEACPDPADVSPGSLLPQTCGAEVLSVDGAGTPENCGWIGGMTGSWCIYPITIIPPEDTCDYGRPLVDGGVPRLAALVGRSFAPAAKVAVDPARAQQWARIALAEHASIASFSRFALQLMALGAPADLIEGAHTAALDELRHARLAFGLASGFAGAALGPGPLEAEAAPVSLRDLAVATAREGCIAETLSALQMEAALETEADPAVRAVLAVLVRDEQRHATLAWRTLRWAVDVGGDTVRDAVAEVFAAEARARAGQRTGADEAWREVIAPAAASLFGAAAS